MFRQLIYITFVLFIFLISVLLALIAVEATHFHGFITASFNLNLRSVFVLIILIGFFEEYGFYKLIKLGDNSLFFLNYQKLRNLLFEFNTKTFFILGVFSFIFLFISKDIFQNLVKAQIGLDPIYVLHLFVLSLYLLVLSRIFATKRGGRGKIVVKVSDFLTVLNLEILCLVLLIVSSSILFYSNTLDWWIKDALVHPFYNYDQKMQDIYGSFYPFMKFVDYNTTSNAVIMRMKQGDRWPWLSNDAFVRYFIYPRYTKEGNQSSLGDSSIKYVFVHKKYVFADDGWDGERWPDFFVPAKRVLYMNNNFSLTPIVVNGNFDPKDKTFEKMWGLIELKR